MRTWIRGLTLGVLAVGAVASSPSAQVTSGSLAGQVTDQTGSPVSQAIVTVLHVPTGTRTLVRTGEGGRWTAANLRPGGPYTVTIAAIGYRPVTRQNLTITLGSTTPLAVVMEQSVTQLAEVVVVGEKSGPETQTGSLTKVDIERLTTVPTVTRSVQDLTRLTPTATGNTFAGSNYRYNNLTIDGAVSNDAFGFSPSSGTATGQLPTGTPGAMARTQPISTDAIDQLTVAMAPYDVKVGNFTGASINAVTRAGTNDPRGSLYLFGRNASVVGSGLSGGLPGAFHEYQVGGSVGGPLAKDKAFFFVNTEVARRNDPVLFAPGSPGTLLTSAVAQQIVDSLRLFAARGGLADYDAGTIGVYSNPANSTKLFGRLDFNLGGKNVLTVRDNFVSGYAGNLERGAASNKLSAQDYRHHSTTNTLVAELKSQLGSALSNSFLVGLSTVSDRRDPAGARFPQIEIQDLQYGTVFAGTDREASVWAQKTRTLELTDNLTWARGAHTITLGTHNEFYRIQYTFLNAYNGRWQYPNLTAFFQQRPNRVRATYSLSDNSLEAVQAAPGADFTVVMPSAYLQDDIALGDRLKVSPGIRVEAMSTTTPSLHPGVAATSALASYTSSYGTSITIAPRLGFNWQPLRSGALTVRGGAGVFQGRMPFVWFANPILNNGLGSANVDVRPTSVVPLIPDPEQQRTLNTTPVFEINTIDNAFVMPRIWRGSLGTDIHLPKGFDLTLEGSYTGVLKDVAFTNEGLTAPVGALAGADNRPVYASGAAARVNPDFSAVYVLKNTNKGYRYNLTGELRKQLGGAVDLSTAYTYGMAKDLANGQRNSFQSNWEFNQAVTPNSPALSLSNYDLRHRVLATVDFRHDWSSALGTSVSFFFSAQSGSPFSYVYSGDLNRDGSSNNDLIFVPADQSQILLTPSSRPASNPDTRTAAEIWQQLDAFLSADPYLKTRRGKYAERNGGRTPWNNRLDLHVAQDVRLGAGGQGSEFEITADVINFGNMLSGSWGKQYFVPNNSNQNVPLLAVRSGNAPGTQPVFSYEPVTKPYQVDDFLSRWQAQFGVRWRF